MRTIVPASKGAPPFGSAWQVEAVDDMLREKAAKAENTAATKVQSLIRGRNSRKTAKGPKKRAGRGRAATEGDKAATKVQSMIRGRNSRSPEKREKIAARKAAKEEDKAATRVQAMIRGRNSRSKSPERRAPASAAVQAYEANWQPQAARGDVLQML